MFWAISIETGESIRASRQFILKPARCPMCGDLVTSTTDDLTEWHWKHRTFIDCDRWREPEGQWHLDWKLDAPPATREIVLSRPLPDDPETEYIHRADIFNSQNLVIELQHAKISADMIRQREEFFDRMIWLFDFSSQKLRPTLNKQLLTAAESDEKLIDRFRFRREDGHHAFEWVRPRKWMMGITKPLFLDFGNREMFQVKGMSGLRPCIGWGNWITKKDFKGAYFV